MAVIVSLVVLYNIVSLVELADDQGGDGGILALGNHPAPPLPAPQFTDNQTLISKECKNWRFCSGTGSVMESWDGLEVVHGIKHGVAHGETGCCPKFTFSTFTPDPNLHKSQIYTGPKFTQTQIYTGPIFTQPRFTQIHFRT